MYMLNTLGKTAENRKVKNFNHINCKKDRRLGFKKENKFEKWLCERDWFPGVFEKNKGWSVLDYTNIEEKIIIELKGRRCEKYTYDTTIIGYNKYLKARKLMGKGYKVFFFFSFSDRLCFYEVPTILPDIIKIKDAGTSRRGKAEYKKHLYIPTLMLYDVIDFPNYSKYREYEERNEDIKNRIKEEFKNNLAINELIKIN